MKLLFLLFSFVNIINNKIKIECVYEQLEEIKYVYGDYSIFERENDIEILYKNQRLDLLDCKFNYKAIYDNDVLTIFYKFSNNDYLNINKYSKGKLSSSIKVDNKFIGVFDILYYKSNYIFVSSVLEYENQIISSYVYSKDHLQEKNGIILVFDSNLKIINCAVYGGVLNDVFQNINIDPYDESIYITGYKDQNSGYDFGNGGNGNKGYLLIEIDLNLDIKNYLVLKEEIKTIEFNDYLTIYSNNYIYLLNDDLLLVSSLKLASDCVFGYKMTNNYYAVFNQNNLKIYDYNKKELIDTYYFDEIGGIDEVSIENDFVYLKVQDKLYKTFYYDKSLQNKVFNYDIKELEDMDLKVLGIPRDFELKDIKYEEGYNRSIFGVYKMTLNYELFTIDCKMEILDRCNITNSYIYPVGYKIKFSGIAYLNGTEISNNYVIPEEGTYELKLIGKDKEIIYHFKAYNMDLYYQDEDLKYWDYEIYKNDVISFNVNYNNQYIVKEVIVNNEYYEFIDDNKNNVITLNFKSNDSGLYSYKINKIIYEYNGREYIENINHCIIIKVLEDKISLVNDFYNDEKQFVFDVSIIENYNLRFFKIQTSEDVDNYVYVPIREGNINCKIS